MYDWFVCPYTLNYLDSFFILDILVCKPLKFLLFKILVKFNYIISHILNKYFIIIFLTCYSW